MKPPRLFVYGTLKTGFENRWARRLHASSELVGPARVRGKLYRISHYPGMKRMARGDAWVEGEIFLLRNPQKILEALDQYEGTAFGRVEVTAFTGEWSALPCWAYEYLPRVGSMKRIWSGQFGGVN